MSVSHQLQSAAFRPEIEIPRRNRRLGDLLVEARMLTKGNLALTLAWQTRHQSRLGEALIAHQFIERGDLTRALSRQWSIGRIDLATAPPDADLLGEIDPGAAIAAGCLPWRKIGGTLIMAVADPSRAADIASMAPGKPARIAFAIADRIEIIAAITHNHGPELAELAALRCPENHSSRFIASGSSRLAALVLIVSLIAVGAVAPRLVLSIVFAWVFLANVATTALRLAALAAQLFRNHPARLSNGATQLADYRPLPSVSILIPLYRESGTLAALLKSLSDLTYSKQLLDVKLILEEGDEETENWLQDRPLPPWIETITVPKHHLRTKPKAMNYALPFCRGEIVGIYDAEDRPAPDQIDKIVRHLSSAPSDVACVQGILDFYNPRQNWLSRCFSIEYAIWFRVLLGGLQKLGLPIPLGGTTVFFRTAVLEKIGVWDAHNVTEDADLGMRLARYGYRCEMVRTTTLEEANCVASGWIGQRSRWLKGYVLTWITHMRNPATLLKDLGAKRFLAFQVLFLGAITSYLATPLFWIMWGGALGLELFDGSFFPPRIWTAVFVSMIVGQVLMLGLSFFAVSKSDRQYLLPWVLTLPLYWSLGAIAAYKAIFEIFSAPFYWDKTRHGLSGNNGTKT